MSSFYFSNDLLVVRWKREVVEDGAALDEPMAKLLSVVQWPSVGGRGSRSEAANDSVAGTAPVRWTVATVESQQ